LPGFSRQVVARSRCSFIPHLSRDDLPSPFRAEPLEAGRRGPCPLRQQYLLPLAFPFALAAPEGAGPLPALGQEESRPGIFDRSLTSPRTCPKGLPLLRGERIVVADSDSLSPISCLSNPASDDSVRPGLLASDVPSRGPRLEQPMLVSLLLWPSVPGRARLGRAAAPRHC